MKFNAKNSYLCINGRKTELTKEQLKQLGIVVDPVEISTDGKIAKIGDYEFIVLNRNEALGTVELLLKDSLCDSAFGDTNDFRTSKIKGVLEDFAKKIEDIVGEENLIEHIVDLTADDGLKCYGITHAKMSLLTANMAREYVDILDEFKLDNSWWLVTPYSTPKHDIKTSVKYVSPDGDIGINFSSWDNNGVRPFCILKSSIFVSKN